MGQPDTLMRAEIREIPDAVSQLLEADRTALLQAVDMARALDPALLVTVARGSSDHACTFLKYACELTLGLPVASVGPSVASVYGARLRLPAALCLTVSQSGQSPDIVNMTRAAARDGAKTVAITNDPSSPLAQAADITLDIHAGPERSVAATKTFLTSAVVGLFFLAEWAEDDALRAALRALPEHLERARDIDWPLLREHIGAAPSLFVVGRGPAWAMANEAALKLKETCQIHAESYSSAEILHGPVSVVGTGFPVLALAAGDAAEAGLAGVADRITDMGARVFITSSLSGKGLPLEHVRTGHPLTDPLALIVSFYAMVERLARDRGADPDLPRHLKKVTETI